MWQTIAVILAVAAAGWYVLRRLRRITRPGPQGGCTCGGHEGPCPLPDSPGFQPSADCQGCDQCPQPGNQDLAANLPGPKKLK